MPSSYSLYEMQKFPAIAAGETVAAPLQLTLDLEMEGIDEPPKTEFTALRRIEEMDIEVFQVFHEWVVKKPGRAKGVAFTVFVANATFPAFYQRSSNLLLLKTAKEVAQGAFKALSKRGEVKGEKRNKDLKSIRHLVQRFRSAWFSVDGSPNIHAQALYGSSIDQDMRFDRAANEGDIYHMSLDYFFKDELIHVGVSDESGIVINVDNLDEVTELELLFSVKANLLDQAVDK